nr:RHS repeat-associated core domain-containing protein [Chengkuizengella sediminis]
MEVDEEGNPLTYYVYGLGLVSQEDVSGNYSVYHYDRRGSTVALTNVDGNTTDQYAYSPYGELIYSEGTTNHPFLYNGRYGVMTDENGLYYMRARYYNPEIKRFINRDVVQGSISSSLSLNKYAYVNGNPISYIDPFGLSRDSDDVGFFGTAWNITKVTADFLVLDDAKTLIDSDASFTAKVIAGASLFPAGKVLKLGKLGKAASGVKATKESSTKVIKHNEAPTSLSYPMAGDNIGIQLGKGKTQLQKNKAAGEACEKEQLNKMFETHSEIQPQITIKTQSGVRTRIDMIGKNKQTGKLECVECKASATAPLTKNQKKAFPEIGQTGGIVVGKGKPPYIGGTQIPPTKVEIKRKQ